MKKNISVSVQPDKLIGKSDDLVLAGYPKYPVGDDIYNKYHEEADIDPEEFSKKMDSIEYDESGKNSLRNPVEIQSGSNLDVPGSELDDTQEAIGSEDEENNYYSIGGDGHSNLDENQGE